MDPDNVAKVVEEHGRLAVGKKGALMVPLDDDQAALKLSRALEDQFDDQVFIAP